MVLVEDCLGIQVNYTMIDPNKQCMVICKPRFVNGSAYLLCPKGMIKIDKTKQYKVIIVRLDNMEEV